MNKYTYFVLLVIALVFTFRNIKMTMAYRKEKKFVDAYQAMLRGDGNAYETMQAVANATDIPSYVTLKAKTLLVYMDLENGKDSLNLLKSIDYTDLFVSKGKYDVRSVNRNIDIFVWLPMLLARAKKYKKANVIKTVETKLEAVKDLLNNRVEYLVVCATADQVNKKENDYLEKLINGEYTGSYEKHYIGLFKRIAAAFLVSKGVKIDEYSNNDLYAFAKSLIGRNLLTDLGVLDKYESQEEIEEVKQVKEIKTAKVVKKTKEVKPVKKTVKKTVKKPAVKKSVKK